MALTPRVAAAWTKTTVPSASVQLIEKRKLATIKALGDEGELSLRMRTGVSRTSVSLKRFVNISSVSRLTGRPRQFD